MKTSAEPSVTFALDENGVGWIVFDAPGSKVNVFDSATQDALAAALDAAAASPAIALVITGMKERIFIAGADLSSLQRLPDPAAAVAFSRRGQALFGRIATSRVPVVCAIHGACAGGGFELALACDWRIASDAPATLIGLPEVSIGTIPGWGGCVRLPRLIGVEPALDHILAAQLLPAPDALRCGLVDEVVPSAELRSRAKAAALAHASAAKKERVAPAPPVLDKIFARRKATILKTRGQQPAPIAAIDVIQQTYAQPIEAALTAEAEVFGQVTAGAVCKNLIRVFFLRETAKKRTLEGWFDSAKTEAPSPTIRKIGVVGAGVMGSGIAHWLATRGFDVVLRDVQLEFVERALGVIRALLEDGVKRGKVTREQSEVVFGRIRTTTEWDGFADCDLVIEAIVENVAAKQQLFADLARIVRPDTLLASNTSALPIEEIAGHVPNPERTLGIHFFNPVSRMPLVELVIGRPTALLSASRALDLVRSLGKSPVICRSAPGFLVTRVLFFYLNAAVRLWEAGIETEAIDGAMCEFGWPMGPLRLIDEVGVDVTASIFGEMAHYYPERFRATTTCDALNAAGLKGRKNGTSRGFYRYAPNAESPNDSETRGIGEIRVPQRNERAQPSTAEIIGTLMDVMVEESRRCIGERVVRTPDEVDFALLSGAGFPGFRGGLLHWADGGQ